MTLKTGTQRERQALGLPSLGRQGRGRRGGAGGGSGGVTRSPGNDGLGGDCFCNLAVESKLDACSPEWNSRA